MANTIPLANYEVEQAAFTALLQPDCDRHLLFFCGESGSGKTRLVETCLQNIPARIPHIPFQMREGAVNEAEIFYRVGSFLGWQQLPAFTDQVINLTAPANIQVDGNRQSGVNNRIIINALRADTPTDREERRAILTEAWFDDLKNYAASCLLLAFDTYEDATTEVANWLAGPFLFRATHTPNLRILLAGQKVPPPHNIEWGNCCVCHSLNGVKQAEHWLPVVAAMGRYIPAPHPLSYLAAICDYVHGRPRDIINFIEGLPRQEAGQ